MSSDTETADPSASSGPSAPGVSELAEVLGAHRAIYASDGDFGEHQWVECSCDSDYFVDTDADDATHRRHVAEVIAASGVVVPAAEVEALLDAVDRAARLAGVAASHPQSLSIRAEADRLRARLAGEGR